MANTTRNVLQIKEFPTHRNPEKSLIFPCSHHCAKLFLFKYPDVLFQKSFGNGSRKLQKLPPAGKIAGA